MPELSCRVLVIGAGPTGLGAAVRLHDLDEDYLLVESTDHVGGMAASETDERGFTWDLGGHVLHSHFPEFDDAVARSGAPMRSVRRNGWVWIDGQLVPTPIQHQLDTMPTDLRPERPSADLGEYYRNHFGADLYTRFFEPFTLKMWAHPLRLVDHAWTSLRTGSSASNVPAPRLASDRQPSAECFPYPAGGAGALWTALHDRLLDRDRSLLATRVTDLDVHRRTAQLDDGRTVAYESCISTVPITRMMRWAGLPGATGDVFAASRVYAVGVGFTGPPPDAVAGKTWLYSPDRDVPWYRATVLSTYDPDNAGDGRWSVLCETSTSAYRKLRLDDVVGRTVASLIALGAHPRTVDTVWSRTIPLGYPVPTLGRDAMLRDVDTHLRRLGIRSRGRFGGWRYESCNQDYSFAQGGQAVDSVLHGQDEDVYWHPERW